MIPNTTEVMISRIAMSTPATAPPVFVAAEIIDNSCHTIYYTLYTLRFVETTIGILEDSVTYAPI